MKHVDDYFTILLFVKLNLVEIILSPLQYAALGVLNVWIMYIKRLYTLKSCCSLTIDYTNRTWCYDALWWYRAWAASLALDSDDTYLYYMPPPCCHPYWCRLFPAWIWTGLKILQKRGSQKCWLRLLIQKKTCTITLKTRINGIMFGKYSVIFKQSFLRVTLL